ncbi:peritrophin-1-like [Ochlerotatus camptorhynchus]|uniref:peritrophin-1-like n=1 Tax=Ochlerotatus camptorhynchus TaxID=644619 RepID=UPI0031E2A016
MEKYAQTLFRLLLILIILAIASGNPNCPAEENENSDAVLLPHPDVCSKYLICSNGVAYEQDCRDGLLFNPALLVCDWPENVECEKCVFHSTALIALFCLFVVGVAYGQNCYGQSNGSTQPDPSRCNFYYFCNNGNSNPVSCPSGLHYNARGKVCDRPSRAGCVMCPSSGFRNLPVAGACNKFIQCFQGVATDRECPKGLLFDSSYGQCNLERNVRC